MVTTTKPNERQGVTFVKDPSLPKALVTPETVTNELSHFLFPYGMFGYCNSIDMGVKRFATKRDFGQGCDALLVMIDNKGNYCVYDSLAQRDGQGLKKGVELHRLKLFTAMMVAVPGLCQDFLSFMSSHLDIGETPHPTEMPLSAITTKATYKMIPEWLKELHSKIQTLEEA